MQRKDIVHQIERKKHDIFSFSFAVPKFLPGDEQVFHRYDIIKAMKSPPPATPVVVEKLKSAFSDWILIAPHIPKIARYGLGAKIENSFVSTLEMVHQAVFAQADKKFVLLGQAITRLGTLSFFLQIAWENKLIPNEKYIILSEKIVEVGKNLGGWKKSVETKLAK